MLCATPRLPGWVRGSRPAFPYEGRSESVLGEITTPGLGLHRSRSDFFCRHGPGANRARRCAKEQRLSLLDLSTDLTASQSLPTLPAETPASRPAQVRGVVHLKPLTCQMERQNSLVARALVWDSLGSIPSSGTDLLGDCGQVPVALCLSFPSHHFLCRP